MCSIGRYLNILVISLWSMTHHLIGNSYKLKSLYEGNFMFVGMGTANKHTNRNGIQKSYFGPLQKALIREKLEGVIALKSLSDLFISLFPTSIT